MDKSISKTNPLDGYFLPSDKNNKNPGILFKLYHDVKIQQIATWPDNISNLTKNLNKLINSGDCLDTNSINKIKNIYIVRIEPLKWWLIGENRNIIPLIINPQIVHLDLSHSWIQIDVMGEKAQTLLSHHIPIDLRNDKFPVNNFSSTMIHNVGIKIFRKKNNGYQIFLPRSYAVSVWQLILKTSLLYGYDIIK